MEKRLPSIALIILLSLPLQSQTAVNDGWVETGSASYNSELFSAAFSTAAIGYAVGSGGACLKTTNGGSSWTAINLNVPYDLLKVAFPDANTGFIGGGYQNNYGKVIKTTDGGTSWQEVLHFEGKLNNMFFLDAQHGWVAGYDQFFSTADGGSTWTTHQLQNFYDVLSIVFLTPSIGFMTPNNASIGVQKTTDGGLTWKATLDQYTNELDFTDVNTIYTLKSNSPGMVYKTTDQGTNWLSVSTGLTGSLKAINFITSSLGFVWSRDPHFGRIFRTTNAGQEWTKTFDDPIVDINEVVAAPGGKIFAVGTGGMILSSNDGNQWNVVHAGPIRGTLRRVAFTGNLNGFAVGNNGSMIKTVDGGINWIPVDVGTRQNLAGLEFVNSQTGFVAGDGSTMYKTVNGGVTWTSVNTGLNTPELRQIAVLDEQNVFAGSNNGIFVTKNGGSSWSQTPYTSIAYTIFLIDPDTLLAAEIQKFSYSYNGGATWNEKSLPRTFFSMYFKSARNGIIGDSWGRVYKTTDGFENKEQKHNCGQAVYDMTFINDTVGYFVADNGYVGKTTDGGESWFQVESNTLRNLKSIFFTPDGTGFIVGKDGLILRKAAVATFSLEFKISDEGGHPLSDAIVSINNSTYPSGVYKIGGLIAGTYRYKISKAGYLSEVGTIEITSDKMVQIILESGLDAPVALDATAVSNEGFIANWEVVTAADSYLLYVSDDSFDSHLDGYNGLEVPGPSHTLTGLEAGVDYYYRLKSKNESGLSAYSNSILVANVLGVDTREIVPITIYPNPAKDVLRISIDNLSPKKLDLFDSFGRLVISESGFRRAGSGYEVDISRLQSGIYLMRLVAGKKIVVKKVVVL